MAFAAIIFLRELFPSSLFTLALVLRTVWSNSVYPSISLHLHLKLQEIYTLFVPMQRVREWVSYILTIAAMIRLGWGSRSTSTDKRHPNL